MRNSLLDLTHLKHRHSEDKTSINLGQKKKKSMRKGQNQSTIKKHVSFGFFFQQFGLVDKVTM